MLTKQIFLLVTVALFSMGSYAASYRAIASGNLSSSSTWQGGKIPPALCVDDDIEIPNSITLTLDRDLQLTSSSTLEVTGNIVSGGKYFLGLISSALTGNGSITLDSFAADFNTVAYTFQGSITTRSMHCRSAVFYTNTSLTVHEYLHLMGALDVKGGSLALDSNALVLVDGGYLIKSTGTLDLNNPHDIKFINASSHAYDLTSGSGLRNVEVATNTGSTIHLGDNTTINGMLRLTSGELEIGNYSLTFSATSDLSTGGTGKIAGGHNAEVIIECTNGIAGNLRFVNGANINQLIINTGNTNAVVNTDGDINIHTVLEFKRGKLHLNGGLLSIKPGATIVGIDSNRYVIPGTSGALEMEVTQVGKVFFPVGTEKLYTPATVGMDTGGSDTWVSIGVIEGVWSAATSGTDISTTQPVLPVTWMLNPQGSSSNKYELEVWWKGSDELNGFDRSRSYISEYIGTGWDKGTHAAAATAPDGMYQQTRSAISRPAYYAVFDVNTVDVITTSPDNKLVSLYPNPATDVLQVAYHGTEQLNGTIYNITGQSMLSMQIQKGRRAVDISSLQPGMYYLYLNGEVQRFIKH